MENILFCASTRWSPSVIDPSLFGFLTILLYAVATCLCLRPLAKRKPIGGHGYWSLMMFWLALLLCNGLFDIQGGLSAAMQCLVRQTGWQGKHLLPHAAALIGTSLTAILIFVCILLALGRDVSKLWPSLLGVVGILTVTGAHAFASFATAAGLIAPATSVETLKLVEPASVALIALNAAFLPSRARRY